MFKFLKSKEGTISKTKVSSIVLILVPFVMGILRKNGIDVPEHVVEGIITTLVGLIGFFLRDAIKKETGTDIRGEAVRRPSGYYGS